MRRNCHALSTISAQLTIEKPRSTARTTLAIGPEFQTRARMPVFSASVGTGPPYGLRSRYVRHYNQITWPAPPSSCCFSPPSASAPLRARRRAPALPAESDRTRLLVPVRRSAADLLAEWRALGVRDDVSHVVRVRDRPITVIGARPGDRNVPAVWLDAQYGVIRFVTFVPRETLPTGPTTLDLAFSEHRRLPGGFFFPYRQELFVGGKLLMLFTVRSVDVNMNLPDALFDPDALRREP